MVGNEYFCEIDADFILDKFNLTGLNSEVSHMQMAIEIITDNFSHSVDLTEKDREKLEHSASHLYGLIHARYILTGRGLQRMVEKYRNNDFGTCPRVLCDNYALLPIGLHDMPHHASVRLYCANCEDLYVPPSSKHAIIDGAYFGTSFPGMLFQSYPALLPTRSNERYVPKIYGFRLHEHGKLVRWQEKKRIEMEKSVTKYNKKRVAASKATAALIWNEKVKEV